MAKLRVDADGGPVAAQDAGAEGMEGAHGHLAALVADQGQDALAHLGGGLVGEGHGQDLPGLHALDADEVGDAVGQHAGLAGAGTGQDEQRPLGRGDGARLLGVEPLDDRLRQLPGIGLAPGLGPGVRLGPAGADSPAVAATIENHSASSCGSGASGLPGEHEGLGGLDITGRYAILRRQRDIGIGRRRGQLMGREEAVELRGRGVGRQWRVHWRAILRIRHCPRF